MTARICILIIVVILLLYILATFYFGFLYLNKLNQFLLFGGAFLVGLGIASIYVGLNKGINRYSMKIGKGDECRCNSDYMNKRFAHHKQINSVIPQENAGRDILNCFLINTSSWFIPINPEKNPLTWLCDTDGTYLSLDGYMDLRKNKNSSTPKGIAFEYQGLGHYKCLIGNLFKYYRDRYNDAVKKRILKENGIPLIILHAYMPDKVLWLQSRLWDILKSSNILRPVCFDNIEQNYINSDDKKYAEPKTQYASDISKIQEMNRGQNGSFKIGSDIWTSRTHSSRKKKKEYDLLKQTGISQS